MKANEEVEKLIQRVNGGDFNKYIADLDGTDFGLYLPAFAEGDNVKLMLQGYSQLERNLAISVSEGENDILGSKVVGWIGDQDAKDSKCTHGSTAKCTHCTTHPSNCRHCTHNRGKTRMTLEPLSSTTTRLSGTWITNVICLTPLRKINSA